MTIQIRKAPKNLITEHYLSLIDAPTELFNPYRMLIMQDLSGNAVVEYRQLKHSIPEITDGNLASHLRVLERAGYIKMQKEILDKKIRTSIELTDKGLAAYNRLKETLSFFIREVDTCNG